MDADYHEVPCVIIVGVSRLLSSLPCRLARHNRCRCFVKAARFDSNSSFSNFLATDKDSTIKMDRELPNVRKKLGYDSGASLMAEGPQVLHEHVAEKFEKALGHAVPQMDIRFSNLSVTADIVVVDDSSSKYELPTIPKTMKKAFVGPKKQIVRKEILKDISGVFTPGKITLLLGQPGSGKSSLLKMLSWKAISRLTTSKESTYPTLASARGLCAPA